MTLIKGTWYLGLFVSFALSAEERSSETPLQGVEATHAVPSKLRKGSVKFNRGRAKDPNANVDLVVTTKGKDGKAIEFKVGCDGYMVSDDVKERIFTLEANGVVYQIDRETLKKELLRKGYPPAKLDNFFEYLCAPRDHTVALDGSNKYNEKEYNDMVEFTAAAYEVLKERSENPTLRREDAAKVDDILERNKAHHAPERPSPGQPAAPTRGSHPGF